MNAVVLAALLLAPPALDAADDQADFVAGLFDKGLYEMAAEEAQAFLRAHPEHAEAAEVRYRLGQALVELDRQAEAEPHLASLSTLRGFAFRAEAGYLLAHCQVARGAHADAARSLERVLASDADYLRLPATLLLAEARFHSGEPERARQAYQAVLEGAPSPDPEGYGRRALAGLAWCAFRAGDDATTLTLAERFLREHADDTLAPELEFLRGEALSALGRPREALRAYERAASGPQADGALRGAAFANAAAGDPAAAARSFERLVERFPDSRYVEEARFQRGVQLLAAGDAEGARAALSLPALPETTEVLYWRARAELAAGRPGDARHTLERGLGAGGGGEWRERTTALLGDVLAELGEGAAAVAAYREAGSDYALYAAAATSLNEGRPGEAARLARSLLAEHPDSAYRADALLALGEALFLGTSYGEAEPPLREAAEALEGDPRARALSRLAWCRFLQDDPGAAAQRFADLVREHPDAPEAEEARYMAARSLADAGDARAAARGYAAYLGHHPRGAHAADALLALAEGAEEAEAVELLRRLLEDHGDSALVPDATYALAERLARAGRGAEARAAYRELLAGHADHALAPAAAYGLAWSHYEAEEWGPAAQVLEDLLRRRDVPAPLRLSGLELAAWSSARAGSPDRALAHYARFAGQDPEDARLQQTAQRVADALRSAGRLDEARAVLEDCASRVRDGAVLAGALVEGVFLSLEAGDARDAEARARAAAERAPDDPRVAEALFFVAEAAFDAGEDARAAELYALAQRARSPVADSALYKEGFALLQLGRAEEAARAFAAVVEEHPRSDLFGECLYLAGEALVRAGHPEAALPFFERLRRDRPRHATIPRALFRGGVALAELGRWEPAAQWLSELARQHPEFEGLVEAELWRGRALARLGDRRGARAAFERVAARHEGVLAARARIEMGRLLLDAGDVDPALSEFLRVAVLYAHPEEVAEALLLAGGCFERLGQPERALEQYRELLDQHPGTAAASEARERVRALQ